VKKHFYHVVFVLCLTFVLALPLHAAAAEFNYTADVEKVVLDNGLTILLKENPAYDIIAMSVLTKGGSVRDPEGLEGLTFLTVRNLFSGTTNRTGEDIVVELESLGVQLQATASYDYSAVLLQAVPAAFEEALAVLLDMIENSTFPVEEFERERSLGFAALQSLYDDPSNALILEFLSFFYGEHPYRYSPYGSPEGLMAIQPDHAASWNRYLFQPDQVVVSLVGSFDKEELLAVLRESFGRWENSFTGTPEPRSEAEFIYPAEDRQMVFNLPTEAAFLIIGYPAPNTFAADAAAMAVINTVLGEGMSSRLFTEIRDKRGLAYTAVSIYDERMGPSSLLTFLATHPQNVEQAREQVLVEVRRFAEEGLSQEEIAWVAAQKRGSYLLNNETNLTQSVLLGVTELIGFGYGWVDQYMDFWDNVTPEDVKAAAQKYFQNYTEVLITP
jgi:zinc protease